MAEQNKGVEENAVLNNVWIVGAGMLIVGLILGFSFGKFWQNNAADGWLNEVKNNVEENDTVASSTVPALGTVYQTIEASSTVSVDNQKAGSLVFIKNTNVTKPTWIAVREVVGDSIGNILGAGMVTGATEDVPVTLLRPTKAGEKYAVFLYQDEGNGQFDFKKDLLVRQNDVPVVAVFTAQ
jgi:hypothetical protein